MKLGGVIFNQFPLIEMSLYLCGMWRVGGWWWWGPRPLLPPVFIVMKVSSEL